MTDIRSRISKHFLLTFALLLISLYILVWFIYGLTYANAYTSLGRHYGKFIEVYPCLAGPGTGIKENLNQFSVNYINVPIFAQPFLLVKGFAYDVDYDHYGQEWIATGTVNAFGHISEESNQPLVCSLL